MAVWYCYGCQEDIGDSEYCPYCGLHRTGEKDARSAKPKGIAGVLKKRTRKTNPPVLSEEECLLYGIHPKDEMYRKTMELDVLSRNYKR